MLKSNVYYNDFNNLVKPFLLLFIIKKIKYCCFRNLKHSTITLNTPQFFLNDKTVYSCKIIKI